MQLQFFLMQLAKVKNERNDEHLLYIVQELIKYVVEIYNGHFQVEEQEYFPLLISQQPELKETVRRFFDDHWQIKIKIDELNHAYKKFQTLCELGIAEAYDYKQNLLFPAYNLIGTINHHAEREDRAIFEI